MGDFMWQEYRWLIQLLFPAVPQKGFGKLKEPVPTVLRERALVIGNFQQE